MKKQLLVAAVLAATAAMQAQAGVMDDGNLSISGFGTLGVAKSNSEQAQFARYNQAEGVADKARIGLDTNLGLQATYKFNDWLSGTAQVLTRKNTSPTFTTDLTWAFLKARVNDETSVRVGRIVPAIFLISDYQNVGYANTMMRPPIEMYGQARLKTSTAPTSTSSAPSAISTSPPRRSPASAAASCSSRPPAASSPPTARRPSASASPANTARSWCASATRKLT
jgi:opacity protein-like surface antigen